jgi:hypothetical protein
MGVLANPDHERFCQLAHKRIWSGEKRADVCKALYLEIIYDGAEPDSDSTQANVRKFYNRDDIKARLGELAEYAAKLAGCDAGWALLRAKRMVEFDTDKFINGQGDISDLPGEVEVIEADADDTAEGPKRSVVKTRIKASDRLGALGLMAKIAGWLAPEKQEHSGALTLEQIVAQSMKVKDKAA